MTSYVKCPNCNGFCGVYRIFNSKTETRGIHKQFTVDVSDKFHCKDCNSDFHAEGIAWGNEKTQSP